MTLAILILLIILFLSIEVTSIKNIVAKYKGYYFITYATQKRGGYPIYHQAIIKGHPVNWIQQRSQEDKSIYYRLLYADNDSMYKHMIQPGNGE